jgi:hypothetical protein
VPADSVCDASGSVQPDGRKLFGGAAIYDADGALLGSSSATWIELRK